VLLSLFSIENIKKIKAITFIMGDKTQPSINIRDTTNCGNAIVIYCMIKQPKKKMLQRNATRWVKANSF